MSYFKCDAGKKYHPFGIGGKEALLQSLSNLHASKATSTADITKDLENVPYFSLPLCMEGAGMTSAKEGAGAQTSKLLERPLVLSCPEIESAKVYRNLATEAINQIFKQQVLSNFVSAFFCINKPASNISSIRFLQSHMIQS